MDDGRQWVQGCAICPVPFRNFRNARKSGETSPAIDRCTKNGYQWPNIQLAFDFILTASQSSSVYPLSHFPDILPPPLQYQSASTPPPIYSRRCLMMYSSKRAEISHKTHWSSYVPFFPHNIDPFLVIEPHPHFFFVLFSIPISFLSLSWRPVIP